MNHYEVLGVAPDATPQQIRRAYRHKVLLTHPDRGRARGDPGLFRRVKEAYEVLADPVERRRYDMTVGLGRYAGRPRFYERSFDRLFSALFSGLFAAASTRSSLSELTKRRQRRAG